jgi:hypothetical protein
MLRTIVTRFAACAAVCALLPWSSAAAWAGEPRLNQIQVIGSHNSYHIAPSSPILNLVASAGKARAEGLDYTHKPLAEQFSRLGIRQVELDVFADPDGGLYAQPALRKMLQSNKKDAGPDPNADGVLDKPGLKVLHVQDVDFLSTARTFVDALKQIRDWSERNPRHVPIMVMVELKDEAIFALKTKPRKFGKAEVESVDAEILSVFNRDQILTPDNVRGTFSALPEALQKHGWPELDKVRGMVMFALDNEGKARDLYVDGHPALEGRLMFTTMEDPSNPAAAWFKVNDPIGDYMKIQKLVKAGFLVRTRADVDTKQARANDVTQRDKALSSGAQFVSTDYAEPDPRLSDYSVRLPGRVVARSNPVSGMTGVDGKDLEK